MSRASWISSEPARSLPLAFSPAKTTAPAALTAATPKTTQASREAVRVFITQS